MEYAAAEFSFDGFWSTEEGELIHANRREAVPLLVELLDDTSTPSIVGYRGMLHGVYYRLCDYALFILIDLTEQHPGEAKSLSIEDRDGRFAQFKAWYKSSGAERP